MLQISEMIPENLEILKIKELQELCRANKLPIYGKKSILIDRIKEFKSKSSSLLESSESLSTVSSSSSNPVVSTTPFPIACNEPDGQAFEIIPNKSFEYDSEVSDEPESPAAKRERKTRYQNTFWYSLGIA